MKKIRIIRSNNYIQEHLKAGNYHLLGDLGKWLTFLVSLEEPMYQVIYISNNEAYFYWVRIPTIKDNNRDFLIKFDMYLNRVGQEIALIEDIEVMLERNTRDS